MWTPGDWSGAQILVEGNPPNGDRLHVSHINEIRAQIDSNIVNIGLNTSDIASLQTDIGNLKVFFNVKDYGAKGDGITDDTSAIDLAIAAIPPTGGTLFFPAGVYLKSTAFEITKRIHFVGEGSDFDRTWKVYMSPRTTIKFTTAHVYGFILSEITNINIDGITFDGNGVGDWGFWGHVVSNLIWRDVTFNNWTVGGMYIEGDIGGTPTNDSSWNSFYDLKFSNLPLAILLFGEGPSDVSHNTFFNTYVIYEGNGSNAAIEIIGCDSIHFFQTWTFLLSGTGRGVYLGSNNGRDSDDIFFYSVGSDIYVDANCGIVLHGMLNGGHPTLGAGAKALVLPGSYHGDFDTSVMVGKGIICKSPNGTYTKRISIDNSGNIVATSV